MRALALTLAVCGAAALPESAPAQLRGGLGVQNYPGHAGIRTSVGYRGIVVSSAVPGSEPAAGQLRSYPLVAGPMAVAGVPGDPAAVYVPAYTPDVTYMGPSRHTVGYGGWVQPEQRRLFRPAPGGSGLPLVTHGGFSSDTYPLPPPYAGYYGTVAPVASSPTGTPVLIESSGP